MPQGPVKVAVQVRTIYEAEQAYLIKNLSWVFFIVTPCLRAKNLTVARGVNFKLKKHLLQQMLTRVYLFAVWSLCACSLIYC